jgi:hypothetical protein
MNFRLRYLYRPGSDLFLVYSESRNYSDAAVRTGHGLVNRAVIAKLTYSLDF